MSGQLRYLAGQLRSDDFAVAGVWRDEVRRRFTLRFFDPGLNSIENFLVAYEGLTEAIDAAESTAANL